MADEFITDNNKYLADGITPNPNYGNTTVIHHPDAPPGVQRSAYINKDDFTKLYTVNNNDLQKTLDNWPMT